METEIAHIGDEDINQEATAFIDSLLRDDETPVAVAGFDFETKVIAVTDQRVIIASGNDGLVLNCSASTTSAGSINYSCRFTTCS